MKIEFDKDIGCWRADGHAVPNWTPDEAAYAIDPKINSLVNKMIKINEFLEKKGQNMLNDDQNEIVVKQLKEKLRNLKSQKENCVRRIADVGNSLHNVIVEIDDIEDVLGAMKPTECDDCCECDE